MLRILGVCIYYSTTQYTNTQDTIYPPHIKGSHRGYLWGCRWVPLHTYVCKKGHIWEVSGYWYICPSGAGRIPPIICPIWRYLGTDILYLYTSIHPYGTPYTKRRYHTGGVYLSSGTCTSHLYPTPSQERI